MFDSKLYVCSVLFCLSCPGFLDLDFLSCCLCIYRRTNAKGNWLRESTSAKNKERENICAKNQERVSAKAKVRNLRPPKERAWGSAREREDLKKRVPS
jgi:hypothetical protein